MKFNWKQSGMPASFVSQTEVRSTLREFRSVLHDAQNQIMSTADAESMAKELVESGSHDYVEMVRELSTSLANARKELDAANQRYERLIADLQSRGISVDENRLKSNETEIHLHESTPTKAEVDEWEEWNRKFQALLG